MVFHTALLILVFVYFQNITAELNAHENVYKAVDDMGRKLVAGRDKMMN